MHEYRSSSRVPEASLRVTENSRSFGHLDVPTDRRNSAHSEGRRQAPNRGAALSSKVQTAKTIGRRLPARGSRYRQSRDLLPVHSRLLVAHQKVLIIDAGEVKTQRHSVDNSL